MPVHVLPHGCGILTAPDGKFYLLGSEAVMSDAGPLFQLALLAVRMENRGHGDALANLAEAGALSAAPLSQTQQDVLFASVTWLRENWVLHGLKALATNASLRPSCSACGGPMPCAKHGTEKAAARGLDVSAVRTAIAEAEKAIADAEAAIAAQVDKT